MHTWEVVLDSSRPLEYESFEAQLRPKIFLLQNSEILTSPFALSCLELQLLRLFQLELLLVLVLAALPSPAVLLHVKVLQLRKQPFVASGVEWCLVRLGLVAEPRMTVVFASAE